MTILKLTKTTTLLLLLFVVLSCASKQQIISEESKIIPKPKLLFLNYQISKTTDNKKTIVLINQKTIDGKLKNKTKTELKTSLGDLEYIILDNDFNEIGKNSIKNPLVKIVEFINDLGNFEKRIIDLDSAQFSMRLQLPLNAKYIVISELTQTGTKKHITTEIK